MEAPPSKRMRKAVFPDISEQQVYPCLPEASFQEFYTGQSLDMLTAPDTSVVVIPSHFTVGKFYINKRMKEEEVCGLPYDDKFCGPGCRRSSQRRSKKMNEAKSRRFCDREWYIPDYFNPEVLAAFPHIPATGFSWKSIQDSLRNGKRFNVNIRPSECKWRKPTCDRVIDGVFSIKNPSKIQETGPVLQDGKISIQRLGTYQSRDYSAKLMVHQKKWCTSTCVLGGNENKTCCSLFVIKKNKANEKFLFQVGYRANLCYNGASRLVCYVVPGLKQDQIARLELGYIRCPLDVREGCTY